MRFFLPFHWPRVHQVTCKWLPANNGLLRSRADQLYNNYSMSQSWIWSDKITNEHVAQVGYNHFISNKGEWNNCFSKLSNWVLPPIFISTILQSVRKEHTTSGHTRPDSRHHLIITQQKGEWKWQLRKRQSVVNLWRKPSSNYLTGQIQGKQTILEVSSVKKV